MDEGDSLHRTCLLQEIDINQIITCKSQPNERITKKPHKMTGISSITGRAPKYFEDLSINQEVIERQ